jgi:hypothetical protein
VARHLIGIWPFALSGMNRAAYAFNLALWTGIPGSIAYFRFPRIPWTGRQARKPQPASGRAGR